MKKNLKKTQKVLQTPNHQSYQSARLEPTATVVGLQLPGALAVAAAGGVRRGELLFCEREEKDEQKISPKNLIPKVYLPLSR